MEAKKIDQIFLEEAEPTDQQMIIDYSKGFIPFSNINEFGNAKYIYFGNEKIPFKNRPPEYQELFINEFLLNKNILVKSVA